MPDYNHGIFKKCDVYLRFAVVKLTSNHEEERTKEENDHTNQLLQKLYYEVDRPSALGGVHNNCIVWPSGLKRMHYSYRTCKHPCVYACAYAYACVLRVNQP